MLLLIGEVLFFFLYFYNIDIIIISLFFICVTLDCEWKPYDAWSSCSKTCGIGQMSRVRSVYRMARNGGEDCHGNATETINCNEQSCPSDLFLVIIHFEDKNSVS